MPFKAYVGNLWEIWEWLESYEGTLTLLCLGTWIHMKWGSLDFTRMRRWGMYDLYRRKR